MSKQQRNKGELYTLSLSAKQRMKMGYWTEVRTARETEKRIAMDNGKNPDAVTDYYKSKFVREFAVIKNNINLEEEELYLKVCNILEKDEDTVNPIGQLVDRNKYENLDSSGKQRYIVMLASKYRELSDRYYREKKRNLHLQ